MAIENVLDNLSGHQEEITEFIDRLDSSIKHQVEDPNEVFTELKWEIESHFLAEERMIFGYVKNLNTESMRVVQRILSDHKIILDELRNIEFKLEDKEAVNTKHIKKLLIAHEKFEDAKFYPILNENLGKLHKTSALKKILKKL